MLLSSQRSSPTYLSSSACQLLYRHGKDAEEDEEDDVTTVIMSDTLLTQEEDEEELDDDDTLALMQVTADPGNSSATRLSRSGSPTATASPEFCVHDNTNKNRKEKDPAFFSATEAQHFLLAAAAAAAAAATRSGLPPFHSCSTTSPSWSQSLNTSLYGFSPSAVGSPRLPTSPGFTPLSRTSISEEPETSPTTVDQIEGESKGSEDARSLVATLPASVTSTSRVSPPCAPSAPCSTLPYCTLLSSPSSSYKPTVTPRKDQTCVLSLSTSSTLPSLAVLRPLQRDGSPPPKRRRHEPEVEENAKDQRKNNGNKDDHNDDHGDCSNSHDATALHEDAQSSTSFFQAPTTAKEDNSSTRFSDAHPLPLHPASPSHLSHENRDESLPSGTASHLVYNRSVNYLFECWLVSLSNDVLSCQLKSLRQDNATLVAQLNTLLKGTESTADSPSLSLSTTSTTSAKLAVVPNQSSETGDFVASNADLKKRDADITSRTLPFPPLPSAPSSLQCASTVATATIDSPKPSSFSLHLPSSQGRTTSAVTCGIPVDSPVTEPASLDLSIAQVFSLIAINDSVSSASRGQHTGDDTSPQDKTNDNAHQQASQMTITSTTTPDSSTSIAPEKVSSSTFLPNPSSESTVSHCPVPEKPVVKTSVPATSSTSDSYGEETSSSFSSCTVSSYEEHSSGGVTAKSAVLPDFTLPGANVTPSTRKETADVCTSMPLLSSSSSISGTTTATATTINTTTTTSTTTPSTTPATTTLPESVLDHSSLNHLSSLSPSSLLSDEALCRSDSVFLDQRPEASSTASLSSTTFSASLDSVNRPLGRPSSAAISSSQGSKNTTPLPPVAQTDNLSTATGPATTVAALHPQSSLPQPLTLSLSSSSQSQQQQSSAYSPPFDFNTVPSNRSLYHHHPTSCCTTADTGDDHDDEVILLSTFPPPSSFPSPRHSNNDANNAPSSSKSTTLVSTKTVSTPVEAFHPPRNTREDSALPALELQSESLIPNAPVTLNEASPTHISISSISSHNNTKAIETLGSASTVLLAQGSLHLTPTESMSTKQEDSSDIMPSMSGMYLPKLCSTETTLLPPFLSGSSSPSDIRPLSNSTHPTLLSHNTPMSHEESLSFSSLHKTCSNNIPSTLDASFLPSESQHQPSSSCLLETPILSKENDVVHLPKSNHHYEHHHGDLNHHDDGAVAYNTVPSPSSFASPQLGSTTPTTITAEMHHSSTFPSSLSYYGGSLTPSAPTVLSGSEGPATTGQFGGPTTTTPFGFSNISGPTSAYHSSSSGFDSPGKYQYPHNENDPHPAQYSVPSATYDSFNQPYDYSGSDGSHTHQNGDANTLAPIAPSTSYNMRTETPQKNTTHYHGSYSSSPLHHSLTSSLPPFTQACYYDPYYPTSGNGHPTESGYGHVIMPPDISSTNATLLDPSLQTLYPPQPTTQPPHHLRPSTHCHQEPIKPHSTPSHFGFLGTTTTPLGPSHPSATTFCPPFSGPGTMRRVGPSRFRRSRGAAFWRSATATTTVPTVGGSLGGGFPLPSTVPGPTNQSLFSSLHPSTTVLGIPGAQGPTTDHMLLHGVGVSKRGSAATVSAATTTSGLIPPPSYSHHFESLLSLANALYHDPLFNIATRHPAIPGGPTPSSHLDMTHATAAAASSASYSNVSSCHNTTYSSSAGTPIMGGYGTPPPMPNSDSFHNCEGMMERQPPSLPPYRDAFSLPLLPHSK